VGKTDTDGYDIQGGNTVRFVVPGKLPSMNQFISANRTSVHVGNNMKQNSEKIIMNYIPKWATFEKKVFITYNFYEPDKRRDHDNIASFFIKVCQDSLVKKGVLHNDGWANMVGFSVQFHIDKKNPRIEIDVDEVD